MSRIIFVIFLGSWVGVCFPLITLGQSNQSESLTISTYYPSPYGVYRTLQVKKGLAVGGSGPSAVDSLSQGQLFINNSVILNALPSTPASASGRAGQVIYVGGTEHMLKFHNGTAWVNVTGGMTTTIISGLCGLSDGKSFSTKPTTDLCKVGATNSTVTGTGPWYWDCTNATGTSNCNANKCTPQAHFPPKKCGAWTKPRANLGCPDYYVIESCTTLERWGTSDTCTYLSSCQSGSDCSITSCLEACTSDWDGTYSCPP